MRIQKDTRGDDKQMNLYHTLKKWKARCAYRPMMTDRQSQHCFAIARLQNKSYPFRIWQHIHLFWKATRYSAVDAHA